MNVDNVEIKNTNVNILTKKNMVLIMLFYSILITMLLCFTNSVIGINRVVSGSMKNTFQINEYYLRNKVAYKFRKEPKRGEVIDFNCSEDLYVKRVIGLPNETVYIKDGVVYIDGEKLEEDYTINIDFNEYGPYKVPEDEYFVLGDNRLESNDSRFWDYHFVKKKDIRGKVLFKFNKEKFKISIVKK